MQFSCAINQFKVLKQGGRKKAKPSNCNIGISRCCSAYSIMMKICSWHFHNEGSYTVCEGSHSIYGDLI